MDLAALATQFASFEMVEMMLMTPNHGHFSRSCLYVGRSFQVF